MDEKQIAGGKYSGKVAACLYHRLGDSNHETWVRFSLDDGSRVDAFLPESEIEKIREGDNMYVSVEITRDP